MAPDLSMVIRKGLQAKQVSAEATDTYIKGLKSLSRCEKSFKLFWAFCDINGLDAINATLSEVAGLVLQFDKIMPSHGRFAYSSLLWIPGLEQLAFNPLLRQIKRQWNTCQARFASLYDVSAPVRKLAAQGLNWASVEHVRLRLLLACRFFYAVSQHWSCSHV